MSQAVNDVKRKRITQEDYDQMKLLLAAGLKPSLVGEVCQRSHGSVNRVMRSASYEDYRESLTKMNKVYHAKADAKSTAPVEQEATSEPEQDLMTTKAYTADETLERIASALERLAEAWEAQPRKNNFFGK